MSITAPEISPKDIKQVAPPGQHERPPRIDTPLKVVIASSFVLRVAGAATGLLLGTYLRQVVGAGTDLIGLLAAIFYVTELTLAPVFGALSDLRGRRPVLVLGPLAGAIAVLVFPLSSVLVVLAVGRLLEGLSTAAKVPGALGYLADATSGSGQATANLRGRVMGLYEISFLVGVVAGNFMGGFLWERIGTMGFVVVSVTYLVATALLFFFVPESLPVEARAHHQITRMSAREASHPVLTLVTSRLKSYADLVREPALRTFLPAWIAVNAVVGLWFTLLQPIMVQSPSHPPMGEQLLDGRLLPSQVGMVFAGFGLIFMVGIYVWSLFYGRLRKTDMMLASMAGMLLVIVTLFAINNNFLPGPWGQWPLVPLAAIGVLLQSGFTPVALAYLAEISGTRVEHRGAVMGLYSVFLGIGQLIGGAGGGFFLRWLNWGFNGLIVATLILSVIAAGAVLYLRGKHGV